MNPNVQLSVEELQKTKIMVAAPMYGGQCHGIFTKATNELSAICAKHGIDLRYYYLFNESLITRARNYCIQRNMMIQTEDGPKTIKWVVDNKYSGKVLSYNFDTQKTEWNNVVNHWGRENKEKKQWVKIHNGTRAKKALICTDDHRVAYIDSVLDNPNDIQYDEAKNIQNKYLVRLKNDISSNRTRENCLYNKEQLSVIIGTLFGDGHINKNGSLTITHGIDQKEYADYKGKILNTSSQKLGYTVKDGKKFEDVRNYYLSNEQTRQLQNMFYDGKNGTRTAKNLIEYIDEIALAFWYMDDGSLHNFKGKKSFATLYSMGFDSYEDHVLIQQHLKNKFDLDCSINTMKYDNGDRNYIQFSAENTIKLSNIIRKYVHPSMRYKLITDDDNSDELYEPDNNILAYSASKVLDIQYLDSDNDSRAQSKLYDIEVENVHNFFANGTLVHNCVDEFLRSDCTHMVFIDSDIGFNPVDVLTMVALQVRNPDTYHVVAGPYPKKSISFEKIWQAVQKDPTIQRRETKNEKGETVTEDVKISDNPFLLEHFVGDYVFNPISGTSFRLDEPVAVAETGTGFMCIPRATLERFAEAYPHYQYIPDHIRTEHFDGSRPIMQFFQAEIDAPSAEEFLVPLMKQWYNKDIDDDQLKDAIDKFDDDMKKSSRRYLSEDYWFSFKLRRLGMNIMLCPWMQMTHMGTYAFGGSLAALASIQASPTATAQSNEKFYKNKKKEPRAIQKKDDESALSDLIGNNRKLREAREKRKKNKK